jgi:chromate transporter
MAGGARRRESHIMADVLVVLRLFWSFARVGLLAWGGGPSMIPLMQQEVLAQKWLSAEEFLEALALGNALPGPIATKMSLYVGYKQAGTLGALAGMAGMIAPSGALMLFLALCLVRHRETPALQAALTAVRPAVIGLLVWTAYEFGTQVLRSGGKSWAEALVATWDQVLIVGVVVVSIVWFEVHPVLVILAAAVFGSLVYR